MVKIAFIWAEDEAGWIGKDNDMPWHLSADLKHFKHLTSGHPVIMGKNTYLSLGRPLPKRTNIVVTRQTTPIEGVTLVNGTWQKVAERHLQATESDPACTFEKWVLNVKQN